MRWRLVLTGGQVRADCRSAGRFRRHADFGRLRAGHRHGRLYWCGDLRGYDARARPASRHSPIHSRFIGRDYRPAGCVSGAGVRLWLGACHCRRPALLRRPRLSPKAAELAAMFLGVQCVINSLSDLRTLLGLSTLANGPVSDARADVSDHPPAADCLGRAVGRDLAQRSGPCAAPVSEAAPPAPNNRGVRLGAEGAASSAPTGVLPPPSLLGGRGASY